MAQSRLLPHSSKSVCNGTFYRLDTWLANPVSTATELAHHIHHVDAPTVLQLVILVEQRLRRRMRGDLAADCWSCEIAAPGRVCRPMLRSSE
jgi:hypothetical protein